MIKIFRFFAWEVINPLLLQIKKGRRYDISHSRGINIGCGIDNPSHWTGVDGGLSVLLARFPSWFINLLFRIFSNSNVGKRTDFIEKIKSTRILHHDFSYGLPFDENSVSAVYSSHFFEHIPKAEAALLLKECLRVMKPGGIIRICVPNLSEEVDKIRKALSAYDQGEIGLIEKFVTHNSKGFLNSYSFHRWMYDFREMKDLLETAGFSDACEREFRKGEIADVEILDTRGGLHVEARKPS